MADVHKIRTRYHTPLPRTGPPEFEAWFGMLICGVATTRKSSQALTQAQCTRDPCHDEESHCRLVPVVKDLKCAMLNETDGMYPSYTIVTELYD